MADYFKSLKIDSWYMVFVYLGGLLLVFSLFIPTQWITNKQLILFSTGILLIGLGEWKNYKHYTEIKEPNVYTGAPLVIRAKIRKPDIIGLFFEAIGLILIIITIINFIIFK